MTYRGVVKKPGEEPEVLTFTEKGFLKAAQAAVGGYIEPVHEQLSGSGLFVISMYAHEAGKIVGLAPNVRTEKGLIVGPVVVALWDKERGGVWDMTKDELDDVKETLRQMAV